MRAFITERRYVPALLWLGLLVFFATVFQFGRGFSGSIYMAIGITIFFMSLYYGNLYWLLPRYWETKRYVHYFVAIALIMGGYMALTEGIERTIFNRILPNQEIRDSVLAQLPPPAMRLIGRGIMALLPLILSALVRNAQLLRQKEAEKLILQNRMLEAETTALRAQINPHLLFNTLNNIYSLVQLGSDKSGTAILQLSDILRYAIYDSAAKFVPLKSELNYLRAYIQLQLLKDENIENVRYVLPEADPGLMIAPMLLVPFVENSFKHSKFEDLQNGWIEVDIRLQGQRLIMDVGNSLPKEPHSKDGVGGVGLENVRRRLELLYPERHDLQITQDHRSFEVHLEIDLSNRT